MRPRAGCYIPGPAYFRFKSSFRDVLQAASQGCKSCLVLKDGIEAQCVGTPQPLTIWIAGEKGRSMDVADKYCQMPTLEFYRLPGKFVLPWDAFHLIEFLCWSCPLTIMTLPMPKNMCALGFYAHCCKFYRAWGCKSGY